MSMNQNYDESEISFERLATRSTSLCSQLPRRGFQRLIFREISIFPKVNREDFLPSSSSSDAKETKNRNFASKRRGIESNRYYNFSISLAEQETDNCHISFHNLHKNNLRLFFHYFRRKKA